MSDINFTYFSEAHEFAKYMKMFPGFPFADPPYFVREKVPTLVLPNDTMIAEPNTHRYQFRCGCLVIQWQAQLKMGVEVMDPETGSFSYTVCDSDYHRIRR